jgi:hypothetical protein
MRRRIVIVGAIITLSSGLSFGAGDLMSNGLPPAGMVPAPSSGFTGQECVNAARQSESQVLDYSGARPHYSVTYGNAKFYHYSPQQCPDGYYMSSISSGYYYYNNHGKSFDDITSSQMVCCKYK